MQGDYNTGDNGNNNLTDEETETILNDIGIESSLDIAIKKEKQITDLIHSQIQENPADKELFDLSNSINPNPDPNKVLQIKRMINSISNDNNITTSELKQQRLSKLKTNLLSRGYTQEELTEAFKSPNIVKKNIIISDNNIELK